MIMIMIMIITSIITSIIIIITSPYVHVIKVLLTTTVQEAEALYFSVAKYSMFEAQMSRIMDPWIQSMRNQPVDRTTFLTDTSSKTKDEDLTKELQTIHGRFLRVDPLK
jgi:hypothetical protein